MEFSSKFIENAVNEISNLPGIGKKSALRLVLFLLKQPESQSQNLANAISQMRLNVNFCKKCIYTWDNSYNNWLDYFVRDKSDHRYVCRHFNIYIYQCLHTT